MTSMVQGEVAPGHADSPSRSGVWLTDVCLLLMGIIWGVNYSVVKFGTALVDPLAFNGVRVTLAAAALVGTLALSRTAWPDARLALRLLVLGSLGNGLYQVLFVEGIARTRAGDAALVLAASPALIALIGRSRGVERVPPKALAGIALSVAGIGLVVLNSAHGGSGGTGSTVLGDMLILAGSLCWAVYTVLLKSYTHRVSPLPLHALTMAGGAVPLLVAASPALAGARWAVLPPAWWGAVGYSGLGALVLAYFFFYRGVRVLGPTRAAIYGNLQPLVAVLVAWIMLGETPTVWQGMGAASIMTGLFLARA